MKNLPFKKISGSIMGSVLSLAVVGTCFVGFAPTAASAQPYSRYDGYCYEKREDAKAQGAAFGAVAGAVLGSNVSGHGSKTGGSAVGAILGALVGSQIASSENTCYGGDYYSFDNGYYEPPRAPFGYETVFFAMRPSFVRPHYVMRGPVYNNYRIYDYRSERRVINRGRPSAPLRNIGPNRNLAPNNGGERQGGNFEHRDNR